MRGGVLAISTPNPDSLQFRLLRSRWVHLDAPRHLQLIPAQTLEHELVKAGMVKAVTVTNDPVGRELNRMGWEYALRRKPARDGATPIRWRASILIAGLITPIERRDLVPTPAEAERSVIEVARRYPDLTVLDREIARWWIV